MQTHKHEYVIHRGESFMISKILRNKDGSPYIISNTLDAFNPHFLLSISDSLFNQEGRYVKNYWLPVPQTFTSNVPVSITELGVNNFEEITSFPVQVYGAVQSLEYYPEYAVFYDIKDGKKRYKYWSEGWKDYECKIIKNIETSDTREWTLGNYFYSIQLVAGSKNDGTINIDLSIPILPPTKISVINYAQGDAL